MLHVINAAFSSAVKDLIGFTPTENKHAVITPQSNVSDFLQNSKHKQRYRMLCFRKLQESISEFWPVLNNAATCDLAV